MKRAFYVIPVAILFVALWSGVAPTEGERAGEEMIMMRCALDSSFSVKAYQGSPAAPGRKSTTCPEQISILAKEGFTVLDTGYFDARDQQSIVYTLSR